MFWGKTKFRGGRLCVDGCEGNSTKYHTGKISIFRNFRDNERGNYDLQIEVITYRKKIIICYGRWQITFARDCFICGLLIKSKQAQTVDATSLMVREAVITRIDKPPLSQNTPKIFR